MTCDTQDSVVVSRPLATADAQRHAFSHGCFEGMRISFNNGQIRKGIHSFMDLSLCASPEGDWTFASREKSLPNRGLHMAGLRVATEALTVHPENLVGFADVELAHPLAMLRQVPDIQIYLVLGYVNGLRLALTFHIFFNSLQIHRPR